MTFKTVAASPEYQEAYVSVQAKLLHGNIKALDLHELAKMQFKARQPLLSPWLHSQDLCMLFASRGVGKTHFAMAISYAVATGGKFLSWQADKPRKVLYLDGELPGTVSAHI